MARFVVAGTMMTAVALATFVAGGDGGTGVRRAQAQAPIPAASLRGQNSTPKPPPPTPMAAMQIDLARLHHAAQREVELGDLAALHGDAASVRTFGGELAGRFRSFDELILGAAAAREVSEASLATLFANENVEGARRAAAALSRLGAVRGRAFDSSFWVALAEEQSGAADLSGAVGSSARDPAVRELAARLSVELEEASRDAVAAAHAPPASAATGSGSRATEPTPPAAERETAR